MGPPPQALSCTELRLDVHCDLPRLAQQPCRLEAWALVFDTDMQLIATVGPDSAPAASLRPLRHDVPESVTPGHAVQLRLAELSLDSLPSRAMAVALAVRRTDQAPPPSAITSVQALVGMRHLRGRAGKGVRCVLTPARTAKVSIDHVAMLKCHTCLR